MKGGAGGGSQVKMLENKNFLVFIFSEILRGRGGCTPSPPLSPPQYLPLTLTPI